jgi:uncharacterized protein (TIGR03083 family)
MVRETDIFVSLSYYLGGCAVDVDATWAVIANQRRALADLLDGRSAEDWERPSLCSEWRVRDVAAHVALTPRSPGLGRILLAGVRARGDFDAVNRDLARAGALRTPAQLVADLRDMAESRRKPAITTVDNLLFDVLVHVQDVALPLGVDQPMPLDAARAGLERVWRMGWPFWARRRLAGLRLEATDVDWTAGAGALVRGPARALLLLLTGRPAAQPALDGPGLARLAQGDLRND